LLRYFEGCAFADIGAKLRLSQDAARMRVDRALLRLQAVLARRGITSTGAALAALLADQAVSAAPAGLAASIGASAMAGASGAGAVSTLIQLMQITKVQIAVATIIFAAGAAIGVREIRANQDLRAEIASLRNENRALPELRAEHIRLIRAEADLNAAITEGEANAQAAAAARRSTRPTPKPIASLEEAMTKGPIYEANTLDQQPLAIDTAGIVYPSGMRQAGLGGKTTVDLVVAIDGSVVGAHAISATNAELADAAVKGVSQWVFKPGQKNGLPVNTHIQIPISFTVRSGP
jgi:TonB family protein